MPYLGFIVTGVLISGSWMLAAWLGYRTGYDQAKHDVSLDRAAGRR